MINIDLILFASLIVLSMFLIFKHKHRVKIESILSIPLGRTIKLFGLNITRIPLIYTVLIKTKIGMEFTEKVVNKFRKGSKYLGYFCIVLSVLGILLMVGSLGYYIFIKLTVPAQIAGPAVAFVLPFKVKGGIYVPLMFWLISIFIIAFVHEFGHGLVARAHNIKIKNTGPAFFGILFPIIPAAYVEPDEKELKKRSKSQQLAVFAAGPAFNMVTALIAFLLFFFLVQPLASQILVYDGLEIDEILSDSLKDIGIQRGEIIKAIGDGRGWFLLNSLSDLSMALGNYPPGSEITIETDKGVYQYILEPHTADPSKSMLGVMVKTHTTFSKEKLEKYPTFILYIIKWSSELLLWLVFLNLGIGLFNLLPMIPLDGGRMLQASLKGFKYEKYITTMVSIFFFGIVIMLFVI